MERGGHVLRGNNRSPGLGGHLATYASAASLYEVGFNHFFRGKDADGMGDQVFMQGHAAPGAYARAFLEGRLSAEQLDHFRRETVPGQETPEFVLMMPFTPRGKDNLIGTMIARCDGEHLGEVEVLQLSKQALIFGPRQMDARIDQDPDISKDLSLWNQKGSEVIRGQMMVLPVGDTFLYVEPIYIQSSGARMPQLQKVVIGAGNELIYRNTYEEAIASLARLSGSNGNATIADQPKSASTAAATTAAATTPSPPNGNSDTDRRVNEIRDRLRRYRELWSQGKYSEAGRELEQIEQIVGRQR